MNEHHRLTPIIDHAVQSPRVSGERSPLAESGGSYVESPSLDDLSTREWEFLDRQRRPYLAQEQATQALEMLAAQKDAPTFGYQVNNYEHCLQSATLALRAGEDEETVVCTLFHDVGFIVCNDCHGEFAAQMLRPYISERNFWMLERHMYFQAVHHIHHPVADRNVRERWRGHPHFEYAAEWVAKYDQNAISAAFENASLADFEPMVRRVFARVPREIPLPR